MAKAGIMAAAGSPVGVTVGDTAASVTSGVAGTRSPEATCHLAFACRSAARCS